MEFTIDTHGRRIADGYKILADPTFDKRLKAFDERLSLLFDQTTQRWVIVEEAGDRSGFNIIIIAEDSEGNPKSLGDWIFNQLFVFRAKAEEKKGLGADRWLAALRYQADYETAKNFKKTSQTAREMILDDINVWRRGIAELNNEPTSDIGVSYRKVK